MAQYQFLFLVAVAASGIGPCLSQSSLKVGASETTPASLLKELEDNSRYKTLEANATLLKLLVDDKGGVSKSEVFDMLHSKDDNQDHVDLPTFPEDAEEGRVDVMVVPDSQAEYLQASESVRKDSRRLRSAGGQAGAAAGVMVLVTCAIVVIAYTALVVWRRIYLGSCGITAHIHWGSLIGSLTHDLFGGFSLLSHNVGCDQIRWEKRSAELTS
ncbi:hypothetical protein KGM_208916A, partial [Danaus plexippus plexippus]